MTETIPIAVTASPLPAVCNLSATYIEMTRAGGAKDRRVFVFIAVEFVFFVLGRFG